jgi:hypothetical protein
MSSIKPNPILKPNKTIKPDENARPLQLMFGDLDTVWNPPTKSTHKPPKKRSETLAFDWNMLTIGSLCLLLFEILQYTSHAKQQAALAPTEEAASPAQQEGFTPKARKGLSVLMLGVLGLGVWLFMQTQKRQVNDYDYSALAAMILLGLLGIAVILGILFSGFYAVGRKAEGKGKFPGAGILLSTGMICIIMGIAASYLRETQAFVYGIIALSLFLGSFFFRKFRSTNT